jgi:hypothetical protein
LTIQQLSTDGTDDALVLCDVVPRFGPVGEQEQPWDALMLPACTQPACMRYLLQLLNRQQGLFHFIHRWQDPNQLQDRWQGIVSIRIGRKARTAHSNGRLAFGMQSTCGSCRGEAYTQGNSMLGISPGALLLMCLQLRPNLGT